MHIEIKEALPDDLNTIKELIVLSIREVCNRDYDQEQIEAWVGAIEELQHERIIADDLYSIVAVDGEEIVGFASLQSLEYLDFLYIHPEYTQRGIGNALFEQLTRYALDNGATKMSSDVSITARPFFLKKGFKIISNNEVFIDQIALTNHRMEMEY